MSAACFVELGHEVVGVDLNQAKVDAIAAGRATVVEERIGELTAEVVRAGRLRATTDAGAAVAATDLALVCVGTPSAVGGGLSTDALARVARQIGAALRGRIFWFKALLAVPAIALTPWMVPTAPPGARPVGIVLSAAMLWTIVFTVFEAPNQRWTSAATVAGAGLGAVLVAALVAWSGASRSRCSSVRLFASSRFCAASSSVIVAFFGLLGPSS